MSHPTTTGPGTGRAHGAGYQPAPEGWGYHPAPEGAAHQAPAETTGYHPAHAGTGYQPAPAPGHFGPPVSTPKRSGRGGLIALVAATALVAAGVGAAVGTIATNSASSNDRASQTSEPTNVAGAPATGDTHAQDVGLCTRYATINSAIPNNYTNAMDILPAAAALQASLEDYPGASAPVRQAISDVVSAYYARMAVFGGVRERGLAEPPADDKRAAQAAYDQAWEVCGLGQG